MRQGYVYLLVSKPNGTLYTGVTSDLARRLIEHQQDLTPGFTTRYNIKTLVWFEEHALALPPSSVIPALSRDPHHTYGAGYMDPGASPG